MSAADILGSADVVDANSRPIVVAIKGNASTPLATTGGSAVTSSLSAVTRVAANVASVTLKAANAARKGLTVFNNSTSILYIKLGAVAAIGAGTESFSVKVLAGGYYEVPYGWTGIVDGIWDVADAAGEALVTELT